ncbi:MAG: hypothetical protein QOI30_2317 [Mycobacterium sp.]|nr:hypothetical protein [Mycobacterium sp.]
MRGMYAIDQSRATDQAGHIVPSMNQASRRRPQQERRAVSEQKLLAATAGLIVERGFGQLSLTAIGQRAGYSRPSRRRRVGLWRLVRRCRAVCAGPGRGGTGSK